MVLLLTQPHLDSLIELSKTGNMWRDPMSYGSTCFKVMVNFRYGANKMIPGIPVVNKVLCKLMMGMFTWHGLDPPQDANNW